MPNPINTLWNPALGIGEVLPAAEEAALPQPRELGASTLSETGLNALYGAVNSRTAVESYLCPDVGDGTAVAPEVFEATLRDLVKKLQASENPKVKTLCEKELVPLLENTALFSAYRGLMLGG